MSSRRLRELPVFPRPSNHPRLADSYDLDRRQLLKSTGALATLALAGGGIAAANDRIAPQRTELAPVAPQVGSWTTPHAIDPFSVPMEEQAELLFAANRAALGVEGVRFVTSRVLSVKEHRLAATSEGALLQQTLLRLAPSLSITAVAADNSDFQSRGSVVEPAGRGWEYVLAADLPGNAPGWGEEAVRKLTAPRVEPGRWDLVLHPSHLWLTIHENIGRPTELDRALGFEANYAGTSFMTPPELGPQAIEAVPGYHPSTGSLDQEAQAEAVALGIERARASGTVIAGFLDVRAGARTLATSRGLFAHHPATGVASTLTARTADGGSSGWAGGESSDWEAIDSGRIAAGAVRKCLDWRGRTALEPGRTTAVLEPTAVGMLMLRMRSAFDARQAEEGRSAFARPGGGSRRGEALFDRRVTLRSDPGHPGAETAPFDDEGLARRATTRVSSGVLETLAVSSDPSRRPPAPRAVSSGVLETLAVSRFWAEQQSVEPRPAPASLILEGGESSLEEMIASTRRGVLITRFWYNRPLNPRTLAYTGLTRDGTFLVEEGRVSRPVNNFRCNQSLIELLRNVEAIGTARRVAAQESSSVGAPIVVPPLKVRDFGLASVSDAV